MTILNIIRERFGVDITEFSGATFSGEIPLTNAVVNRFIAAQLARRQTPLSSVHVEAQEGDAIVAHLTPSAKLVPPVRVVARIERQPELPNDPVMWLRWSVPGIGPLALFAAPALAFFKAMPPGIRVEGDRIAIDIRELLVSRGFGDVVGYLNGLRINTRPGAFIVRVEVRT